MAFLYDSHMGGFYSTKEELSEKNNICEICNSSDWLIGEYENLFDAWCLLKDKTNIFGTGGYSLTYVASWFSGLSEEEIWHFTDLELLGLIKDSIYD